MQTRGYKSDPSLPNEYSCSSPYKVIGNGWPLENNLAYYVQGDAKTANELKLVLNVNDLRTADTGHQALTIVSHVLTKRAFGAELADEVLEALLFGLPGRWSAGSNRIQVVREDWPTSRGYEVKFIISSM